MKKGSGIYRKDIAEHIADDIEIRHMNIHNDNDSNVKISTIETEVFNGLIKYNQKLTAKAYEGYRSIKEFQRNHKNTTDEQLNELLSGTSDYWNNENSNKNSRLLTTQRDYMAGILSTDISRRFLLPTEIVQAHDEGLIHFHDIDYFAQNAITNCSLINLKDMLQNGTCINGVTIDPQHKLLTATTVTTQIITAVTSSQYGGTTITLTHLAPYVRMSYESYYRKYIDRGLSETDSKKFAEEDIKKEVEASVQTFNYQCNSMTTTNGQSPFLTVFMYLNEDTEYIKEVAMLTEEFLKQRITGLKNKVGVNVTQAFPKLIYVLDENNITENSEYWYLTVLAAKCTAKRLVPDYISSKMMKELKGDIFPSMGCVDGNEVIIYQYNNNTYTESFERMWNRLANYFDIESQPNGKDYYIKTKGVKIFDQTKGFVENYGIIKNHTNNWVRLTFSNGRVLTCTPNHPFENQDGKIILAKDITKTHYILTESNETENNDMTIDAYNCFVRVTSKEFFTKEGYSYDVTTASEHFTVSGIYSHNCRSFLSPDNGTNDNISNAKDYVPNEHKYYGRFNEGVVTLNLVDVALSSGKNENLFWKILEDRLNLCHKALRIRHERLLHTSSDVAPIIWQYGAFARLKEHEPIDKLLCDKYATISLGYAGLYETVKYMTGHSHSDNGIGKNFGMKVMQKLNDTCEQWKNEEHIGYSVYGSPIESTTYKFAKCLRNRFGVIEGITDKNYITNSYHIPVTEKINPFDKLKIESEFQKLSLGGAISYIECADLTHNVDSVLSVLKYIYDNIMYAELNTKSDYCQKCGYDGEIKILDENNTLIWECPNCGNRDTSTMNVSRRTCGKLTNIATI